MTEDTQLVDLDKISAEVTNTVNDLPASPPPDQEGIRELVERLQKMIEGDENLKAEDKAEALKQVQALAEASKNPLVEENKSIAESAMMRLRGKVEEVPEATNFSQACNGLLPQINTIFGLGN